MRNIKKKWNFLFKQTFGNFRKNYLIIIGFSVTLSLVAGLAFYTQELEEYIVLETTPNLNDITITFGEYNGNMVRDYSNYGGIVQSSVEETDITIDTVAPFSKIRFSAIMNITPNDADKFPNFLICNDSFYDSEFFNVNFEIMSGVVPKNETSILIPIEFAEKYSLRIGQNLSIQLNYESFYHKIGENIWRNSSISLNGPQFNITVPDLVISGFYGLKTRDYIYFFSEIHRPEHGGDDWLFLGFHDVTQNESLNPILNTYFMLQNNPLVIEIHKYFPIMHGFSIFLDRSWIDPNWLNNQISFLSREIYILEQNLPSELILDEFITRKLEDTRNLLQSLQMGLPFINLPIGIFTIYIGGFLITMNLKNRLDEILLLKLRGVPFEILRSQIILENLINGVISSLLGTGLGWFSKNLYYETITPFLFFENNEVYFTPSFSFDIILQTLIFGVIIAVFAAIRASRFIKTLDISDILKELGQENLEVEYDEYTLFGMNREERMDLLEDNIEFISEKEENELYNNIVELVEKKQVKRSLIFLLFAFVPIFYFLLIYLGMNFNAPDWLINFGESVNMTETIFPFLNILISILIPIFLTNALIRYLITESPSRFARFTKKISSIFLKKKSYLAGIQILKEKKLNRVIFIFALITSILTLLNATIYTSYRYSNLVPNFQVGTDAKITGEINFESIQNHSDVIQLQEKMSSLTDENGLNYIKNIMFYYYKQTPSLSGNYFRAGFLNLSHYISILQTSQNILPNPLLILDIQEVISYNDDTHNNRTAVLYSSDRFYPTDASEVFIPEEDIHNFEGKSYNYQISYYNKESDQIENGSIPIIILHYLDVFPGIYGEGFGSFPILDMSSLNLSSNQLIEGVDNLGFFIDFNEGIEINESLVEEIIGDEISPYFLHFSVDFYNHDWNNYVSSFNMDDIGYFGLIYFSIIFIGGIFAFALAVLFINFHRENSHINSMLRARGVSRRQVRRIMTSQIFVVFLISCGTGLLTGLLSAFIFLKTKNQILWADMRIPTLGFDLPLFFNFFEIFGFIFAIIISSMLIFRIVDRIDKRKAINTYLRQM